MRNRSRDSSNENSLALAVTRRPFTRRKSNSNFQHINLIDLKTSHIIDFSHSEQGPDRTSVVDTAIVTPTSTSSSASKDKKVCISYITTNISRYLNLFPFSFVLNSQELYFFELIWFLWCVFQKPPTRLTTEDKKAVPKAGRQNTTPLPNPKNITFDFLLPFLFLLFFAFLYFVFSSF